MRECDHLFMNSKSQIKFLVVEDELEISDIICLFLASRFDADFTTVHSGQQAVAELSEKPGQFQMVISDFNMAEGNGKFVFDYMRLNTPQTPFVLITSDAWSEHPEFHHNERVGYVAKPFSDEALISEVERLFMNCAIELKENRNYVGISIPTLVKIKQVSFPLFIKINEDKYVRLVNPGGEMTPEDSAKYHQKGIHYLYVEKSHFSEYIGKFKTKVLSDMIFKGPTGQTREDLNLTLAVQEVVLGAVRTFGLSDETQVLAKKSFEMVRSLTERISELNNILDWAQFTEEEYNFTHGLMISLLATDVARAFNLNYPHSAEILAMAACFHDVALENHQIRNEPRFVKALLLNSTMNKQDLAAVRDHTEAGVKILRQWKACPAELIDLIAEHHERPDGSGFPKGKNWEQISDLSACFIVSEDLAQMYLELRDRAAVEKYFAGQAHFYNRGIFKKIHEYLLAKLQPVARGSSVAS